MIGVLKFIFSSVWIYLGCILILLFLCSAIVAYGQCSKCINFKKGERLSK